MTLLADVTLVDELGRFWDVCPKFMRHWINSVFFLPNGTLKLYFKNVIIINFIEWVKLTFSGRP